MIVETIQIKEMSAFSELFLGISILYLVIYGIFISFNRRNRFPLLQHSMVYLGILVIGMAAFLFVNDKLIDLNYLSFNNTFSNDYLSFASKLVIAVGSIVCLLMMEEYLVEQRINHFEYVLIILFAVLGIFLLCSANDLITAYLSIELQSLSFYILAAFKKNSTFSVDAGLKYFVLGAFSSGLFLFGASLIYGITGTVNFEDFKDLFFWSFPNNVSIDSLKFEYQNQFDENLEPYFLQFALIFVLTSLFFKLALAPFHLWSPDVYEGSPTSSSFFFAVVPKLSIFVLLLRIYYCGFYSFIDNWRYSVSFIGVASIFIGSFVGLEQKKLKSLLAYSSISHMGYLLLCFISGIIEGVQILFSYLIVYMCSGLCIWSIFVLTRIKANFSKKQNKDLTDLVLLRKSNKALAFIFSAALFSVAGIPPLIGFVVKFSIFLIVIESSMYFIAFLSILFSVISTFYYIRIIKIVYFEEVLVGQLYYPIRTQKAVIVAFLFYLFLFLFINPTFIYLFSCKLSLLLY